MSARFHNRYPHARRSLFKALRWLREFRRRQPLDVVFPMANNDPVWLARNRTENSLTWIGHASFLLQWGGRNVLTDPHFSERASPFSFAGPKRLAPPGLALEALPPIDLILISHNHYDHLDDASVRRLALAHPHAHFIVPHGLRPWLLRRGAQTVIELDWWQTVDLAGYRVTAVPAQHFSGRGLFDRDRTLWCGFVLEVAGARAYFAGDTGYSQDFADIGQRYTPIDLAMIPIGAYAPRWFMEPVHVDPEQAVRIHQDVGARRSVAMHWGGFRLTAEPPDEPPLQLKRALQAQSLSDQDFSVLRHGETLRLGSGRLGTLRRTSSSLSGLPDRSENPAL